MGLTTGTHVRWALYWAKFGHDPGELGSLFHNLEAAALKNFTLIDIPVRGIRNE